MRRARVLPWVAVGLVLGIEIFPARAANAPPIRALAFVHVCEGGANKGLVCVPDPDPQPTDPDPCPGGTCSLVMSGRKSAKLTVVVDDDVTSFQTPGLSGDGAVAATVIIEAKKHAAFVQTYQQLDQSSLAGMLTALRGGPLFGPVSVDEDALESLLSTVLKAEFNLLYLAPGFGFTDALRAHFGITTDEVLAVTRISSVEYTDNRANALASFVKMKIGFALLQPVQP